MTMPKDRWDRDEQDVVDRLAEELNAVRARHADEPPSDVLRAAHAEVLPDDAQAEALAHLSTSAWNRTLVEGLNDAEPAMTENDRARLLQRIQGRAHESAQPRLTPTLWQRLRTPAFAMAAIALVVTVSWLSRTVPTPEGDAPPAATSAPVVTPDATAVRPPPVLPLEAPPIKLSVSALTFRGAPASNRFLTDLKPGLDAFRNADYETAARELAAIAPRYPSAIEVPFYLGVARLLSRDVGGAVQSLTAASALADASFADDVAWYLAVAHERNDNRVAARDELTGLCRRGGARAAEACDAAAKLQ